MNVALALLVTGLLPLCGLAHAGGFTPSVAVSAPDGWFPKDHTHGVTVSAIGCSSIAHVTRLAILIASQGETTKLGDAPCIWDARTFHPAAPGEYGVRAQATDANGLVGVGLGSARSAILPYDATAVSGFPPLASMPAPAPGASVTIDTWVTTQGDVRAYRVSMGSAVVSDTEATTTPVASDSDVTITLNPIASAVTISMDGATLWNGLAARVDDQWWHLAPVPDSTLVPV